jgi:hypothetical protein
MPFRYVLDKNNELVIAGSSLGVTASSESALVAANASMLPVALVWRAVSDTAEWIEFDLGAAASIDFAAVVNCNLSASPTDFNVKGGTTANPTDFTQAMPAGQIERTGESWATFSSAQNFRYWRVELNDPGNSDGYVQVGYVVLGTSTDWTFSYLLGWGPVRNRVNRRAENQFGAPFVGPLIKKTTDLIFQFGSGESDALDTAEADNLEAFLESLEGGRQPLFYVPEGETATSEGYFGRQGTQQWERRRPFAAFSTVGEIVLSQDNPGVRVPL